MRDVEEITEVLQDDIKVGKYTGKMSVEEYKQTGSWKLGGIKLIKNRSSSLNVSNL